MVDSSDPEEIRLLTSRLSSAQSVLYGTLIVWSVLVIGLSYTPYRLIGWAVILIGIAVAVVLVVRYLRILSALRAVGGGPRWRPAGGLRAYPLRARVIFVAGWVMLILIGLGYLYLRLRLTVFH